VSLEALIRRDRAVAGSGLAALVVLSWAYLLHMSAMDMHMDASMAAMPMREAWTPGQFLLTFAMWAVMMVAMMIPSAGPMILTFAAINRRRASAGGAAVPPAVFVAGYLAIWSAFSLLATAGQWALNEATLLSPATLRATPAVGGVLLLAAGIYQLTPLKLACLARCRSPIGFVLTEWRDGARGALVMGIRHGAFCVGCCWALMALLFVAGVMNLLWVAAIAAFVLLEKVTPPGRAVSWVAGAALLAWGAWMLVRA
jgi:predicted metal-binding membrane protein